MTLIQIIAAAIAAFFVLRKSGRAVNWKAVPAQVAAYRETITEAARRYGVPAPVLAAMIAVESSGNRYAVGRSGEVGLMQITPAAYEDVKRAGLYDAGFAVPNDARNVFVGAAYLSIKLRETNDLFNAIRAYNGGYVGTKNNPGLSVDYANRVLKRAKEWQI